MGDAVSAKKVCKVLVVEDDCGIRELLSDVFETEGYRFTLAANGAEMRDALASDRDIDILIVDVSLPGGEDGRMLAQEAASRGLPVILTSGDRAHFDDIAKCGHRRIAKPFRLASLLALIDETLQATKADCERAQPAVG